MASTHESTTFDAGFGTRAASGAACCSRRRSPHVRVSTPPLRILAGTQRAEEVGIPAEWHEHRYRRRT